VYKKQKKKATKKLKNTKIPFEKGDQIYFLKKHKGLWFSLSFIVSDSNNFSILFVFLEANILCKVYEQKDGDVDV